MNPFPPDHRDHPDHQDEDDDLQAVLDAFERGEQGVTAPPAGTPSITCPNCGMTSYSIVDVREGYCSNCHAWTSLPGPARTRERGRHRL